MLETLLIIFTCGLLLFSIRKTGPLPFPTGLIFILGVSQILFALAHAGLIHYTMLDAFYLGGLERNYTIVQCIYSLTALVSLLTLIGKMKSMKALKLDYEVLTRQAASKTALTYVTFAILGVGTHLLLFCLVVDWHKLWFHRTYLQPLVDKDAVLFLGLGATATVMRATPFVAILSIVCVCLLIGSRSIFFRAAAALMAFCYFLILLSINSRSAVFVPALVIIYYSVLRLSGRAFVVPFFATVSALTITSVLFARSTYAHGLSMVPFYFFRPLVHQSLQDTVQVLLDFCQGIFVTAESLQITAHFPGNYRILAFSPLPSVVDGYSHLMARSEHRLSSAVPMSGIGEAIHFGRVFVLLLVGELYLVIRVHLKLIEKSPVVFLLCNFLVMFTIYLLFSYPTRNALRYGWVALFVALVALVMQGGGRKRREAVGSGAAGNLSGEVMHVSRTIPRQTG